MFSRPEPLAALWHYKRVDRTTGEEYLIREDGAIFTRVTYPKGKGNTKWGYVQDQGIYDKFEGVARAVDLSFSIVMLKHTASPRLKKDHFAYRIVTSPKLENYR